jgi:hypothetical protein
MTDLDICKRIAEIEGHFLCEEWDCCDEGVLIGKGNGDLKDFNPLTDDALCFKLMVKYRVYCEPFMLNENWSCRASSFANTPENGYTKDNSLNKAICLAIIGAHKS